MFSKHPVSHSQIKIGGNFMTPKERVLARLSGKPVDRPPNFNIIMCFAAKYCDIPYDKFCLDYKYLVEAFMKASEDFGVDLMNTMSDPYRETYDFGGTIEFPTDSLPLCKERFIQSANDLKKLKSFDPLSSTRMLDRIRAIELYKSEVGEHYPIMGWVE